MYRSADQVFTRNPYQDSSFRVSASAHFPSPHLQFPHGGKFFYKGVLAAPSTVAQSLKPTAAGESFFCAFSCQETRNSPKCSLVDAQVCAPGNSTEVVRELSKHPHVLADVLSLAAASEEARLAAASEESFAGVGSIPCIEVLRSETACPVPPDDYEVSVLGRTRSRTNVTTLVTGGDGEEGDFRRVPSHVLRLCWLNADSKMVAARTCRSKGVYMREFNSQLVVLYGYHNRRG